MSRKRFSLRDAQDCADRFIAEGRTCGGCKFYSKCGIGDRDRAGLITLLDKVDPRRRNLTYIALGPLAEGRVS